MQVCKTNFFLTADSRRIHYEDGNKNELTLAELAARVTNLHCSIRAHN